MYLLFVVRTHVCHFLLTSVRAAENFMNQHVNYQYMKLHIFGYASGFPYKGSLLFSSSNVWHRLAI